METSTRTEQAQQSVRSDVWQTEEPGETSSHSGLDSYLQELPATLEPRALEPKLGAPWPQAKVHGLNKCPEAYTAPAPQQGDRSQAEDLCAPRSALHQTESQTQLEPARGKRQSRRKRLPAYSRDLVQLSLDVAQSHPKTNTPANAPSHKRQQWIYKPWTESRCRSLKPARCVHDNSFAIDTIRYDRPPGAHLCAAIGKYSLDHCPSRKERERETRNGPWESWYQDDWFDDWPDQDRWSWRNPHPRDNADDDWGPEEEEDYEDTEEEDAEDRDISADSRESYENATSESSPICKPRKKNRTPAPPASKRSRSTQVSDEFVRRQQEAESPQTAPTEDLCATQIQRLHRVVELLEQLAQAGLPTLLSTYYRSGDFTKHHNTFHGHPSTAEFPRVGNWNLSLTGSLLCPHLRGIYNNVETFGSFMESFTVCNAQKKHRPAWYGNFSLLVQLIAKMMDTCTPATYDASAPRPTNSLEATKFDHHRALPLGERAKEISKALTQLLRHAAPWLGIRIQEDGYVDMGDLLRAPRFWNQWITEAEVIDVIHHNQKNRFEVSFQRGHYQVRALQGHSISHVRDDLVLTQLSIEDTPEYAAHGTYYDFYESILRHGLMAGGQQGPSFRRHVYDFYESILRHGLMAGGQQGPSFRRHVHLVEQLPWEGAISGVRSDCDFVIWIRTREAAASGVLTADGGPPHPQQALARLALQQETALKILRQDYSWVLFVQPDNQGPLPLLFAAAQKWKKSQEEGATTTALRTTLFGCLIQMLHAGLKDIGGAAPAPFQTKAEEMKWLKDGSWCYQKWSPALGSLVIDEDRPPLRHAKLVEALQPYMIHRFHAARPLAGNVTGVTTFQLDISNRTKGHNTVWECLEALTGLSALQIIGLQLRRDTLKQSPAATLVQQALAEYS
eukprot:s5701_g7.t1